MRENSLGLRAAALIVLTIAHVFFLREQEAFPKNMLRTSRGLCCSKQEKLSGKRVNCESEFAPRSQMRTKGTKRKLTPPPPTTPPPALRRRAEIFKRSVAMYEHGSVFATDAASQHLRWLRSKSRRDFGFPCGHAKVETQIAIELIRDDKGLRF